MDPMGQEIARCSKLSVSNVWFPFVLSIPSVVYLLVHDAEWHQPKPSPTEGENPPAARKSPKNGIIKQI